MDRCERLRRAWCALDECKSAVWRVPSDASMQVTVVGHVSRAWVELAYVEVDLGVGSTLGALPLATTLLQALVPAAVWGEGLFRDEILDLLERATWRVHQVALQMACTWAITRSNGGLVCDAVDGDPRAHIDPKADRDGAHIDPKADRDGAHIDPKADRDGAHIDPKAAEVAR